MRVFRKFRQLLDVDWDNIGDGDALVRDGDTITGGTAGGGGGAPTDATYITQTANGDLDNEQALSALSTGLVKVTNGTGVLSTAIGGTDYANASHQHAGEDITSGTVADARIASTIARDSEVAAAISAHESDTTNVHGITDTSALETTSGAQAKVDAHVNDTSAAHAASAISIADAGNDFTATDVEGALAELQSDHETDAQNLADHLADTTDAHAGTAITNVPAGNIAATTVQAAINELDTEKQPIDSDLTAIAALSPSNDDIIQRKGGAWTNRTIAQLVSDLGLGSVYQAKDTTLDTYAGIDPSANVQAILGAADYAAIRTLLGLDVVAAKASDTTLASQDVPQNDPDLLFAIGSSATEVWFFDCYMWVEAANTTMDMKLAFAVPASASMRWGYGDVGGSTSVPGFASVALGSSPATLPRDASLTVSSLGLQAIASTPNFVHASGWVRGGGTSGNVQAKWSQNTSDGGNLVVKNGSFIRARKVVS